MVFGAVISPKFWQQYSYPIIAVCLFFLIFIAIYSIYFDRKGREMIGKKKKAISIDCSKRSLVSDVNMTGQFDQGIDIRNSDGVTVRGIRLTMLDSEEKPKG